MTAASDRSGDMNCAPEGGQADMCTAVADLVGSVLIHDKLSERGLLLNSTAVFGSATEDDLPLSVPGIATLGETADPPNVLSFSLLLLPARICRANEPVLPVVDVFATLLARSSLEAVGSTRRPVRGEDELMRRDDCGCGCGRAECVGEEGRGMAMAPSGMAAEVGVDARDEAATMRGGGEGLLCALPLPPKLAPAGLALAFWMRENSRGADVSLAASGCGCCCCCCCCTLDASRLLALVPLRPLDFFLLRETICESPMVDGTLPCDTVCVEPDEETSSSPVTMK